MGLWVCGLSFYSVLLLLVGVFFFGLFVLLYVCDCDCWLFWLCV